jgi:2-iminoacetate synthase
MNTFWNTFQSEDKERWQKKFLFATASDVQRVLSQPHLSFLDFLILLSPSAEQYIEEIAQKAHQLTLQRFGRVIQLYTPLYVSNECYNSCTYCSFTKENKIARKTLNEDEFLTEFNYLVDKGFQNILILSGEDQRILPLEYFENILRLMDGKCAYKGIEIYPLDLEGYQRMQCAGVDGVVVYQETYNEKVYKQLHIAGPKRLFGKRMQVPDWVGQSGIRHMGIGVLLGLSDWRMDVASMAFHAQYLMQKYWEMKMSISVPRIRKGPLGFSPKEFVSDKHLVQVITALRLFLPDCGLVLSTRETAEFRDHLIPLGVTQMSAGSVTNPGGYQIDEDSLKQFSISDERSVKEFVCAVKQQRYEVVWKDWEMVMR